MSREPRSLSDFWHPRYWGTWLALGLFRFLSLLPVRFLLALSRPCGFLLGKFWTERIVVARTNIALCFPELSAAEQARLLRSHFRSVAMGLFEISLAWWGGDQRLSRMVRIEGGEFLEKAQSSGRGVILLSAHFTCVELALRLLSTSASVDLAFRHVKSPLIDAVMYRARDKHVAGEIIDKTDMRRIIRRLRAGATIVFLPDQSPSSRNRVDAEFFGVPAMTNIAFSRMADMTKSVVLPVLVIRDEDRKNREPYLIRFFPTLDDMPEDPVEIANVLNTLFESWIRTAPEQYFWIHRRFKNIPNIYADAPDSKS